MGLPTSVPGAGPRTLVEWARRAEERGFASLGVVDRYVFDTYEPLTALAGAAAVTDRIGLATTIAIAPVRAAAMLAHESATLNAISNGRFTLGLSIGARSDDYRAAGVPTRGRGDRLTRQLAHIKDCFERDAAGPSRKPVPRLLVGGTSDLAFHRMARYADGYVHGGGPPRAFARAASTARAAWVLEGRPGRPELWGQGYFALGENARAGARAYMRDYYAFTGPFAERIAAGLLETPQDVAAFARGYAEAGCDELMLMPADASLAQIDRLAEVLSGARV